MNKGLLLFKTELMAKKSSSGYVPLTMDELMNRFVLNLHRNETIETFNDSRKKLAKVDLLQLHEDEV